MKEITIKLTVSEASLLAEALDSHLYWQLSEDQERNDGFVYYPEIGTQEYLDGSHDDQERWQEMKRVEVLEERIRSLLAREEK